MQSPRRTYRRRSAVPRPGGRATRSMAGGLVALALCAGAASAAQPPVGLGVADSFAVLAGSTITNTGPSTINGDLGLSPGTAVTGFPPGTVNGTIHAADGVAGQAQADLTTAYVDAAGRTPPLAVSGDLGGLTVIGGVYKSDASLGLTGVLTLDAQGDPSAVFVFQAGSTLITASGSRVVLVNGAQPCNVFWQVGSSATLGTTSVFAGNILALTSISMNNGVVLSGRALARNGAVTLINDTITAARCAEAGGGTPGTGATPGTGTPGTGTPGTGAPGQGNGSALLTTNPPLVARQIARFGTGRCVDDNFSVVVRGLLIRRVVFSLGGRAVATRAAPPFQALVIAPAGIRTVTARVTFSDTTPEATLRLRFKVCAEVAARPPRSPVRPPPGFTG
jgi:Ice-binding-like